MDAIIRNETLKMIENIQTKYEVSNVINGIIDVVEEWHQQNEFARLQGALGLSEMLNSLLVKEMHRLEEDNKYLQNDLQTITTKAIEVREDFVCEVGQLLSESKYIGKLKARIRELETNREMLDQRQENNSASDNSNDDTNKGQKEVITDAEKVQMVEVSSVVIEKITFLKFVTTGEDATLLQIFSFLHITEVLNVAQTCRTVFKKIDILFGNESSIIKAEWDLPSNQHIDSAVVSSISRIYG
jgi:hypothetical protein